jgi:hypothetical protein
MMGHHARQPNAFRGKTALKFVNQLIDAIEGMFTIKPSSDTESVT